MQKSFPKIAQKMAFSLANSARPLTLLPLLVFKPYFWGMSWTKSGALLVLPHALKCDYLKNGQQNKFMEGTCGDL